MIDAGVALKWFFRSGEGEGEADVDTAISLLRALAEGRHRLLVPGHFTAEVAAVLARETPRTAKASIGDLLAIEMERSEGLEVIRRATDLSIRFGHHLFDTLYHAVALEADDALLVTADDLYYRKAARAGRIVRLADFSEVR